MNDPRTIHRQALALFGDLLELPAAQREAALAEAPPEVRARVEALLAADRRGSALEAPQAGSALLAVDLAQDRASSTVEVPETIGQWRIVGLLGTGGMGVVYRAEQERPRRQVALKVLRSELRRRHGERFRAEADALAGLVHPAIPQIYETGESDGVPWIAMEVIDGVPIDRWARTASVMARLDVLIAVCRAVALAHARGLVHRDLTPANVLVTAGGAPKVMDFGLAAMARSVDLPRAGTRGFMSPEAEAGAPPTPAMDVYALGCLARLVLTELPRPFREDLPFVLAQATAHAPLARYPDAGALGDDLDRLARGFPVSARPPSWLLAVRRFGWRNRSIVRAVAVSAGVVLVAGAAWQGGRLWQETAREAEARRRLSELQASLDALIVAGSVEEAQRVLEFGTRDDRVMGTAAAAEAWLTHTRRLREAGQWGPARRAIAELFLAAGPTESVLDEVAAVHHVALDAPSLGVTLDRLEGLGARRPAWRAAWAAWSRDLGRAAAAEPTAPLAPLWAAWAHATPTPWRAWAVWEVNIGGQPRVVVADQMFDRLGLAARDPGLTSIAVTPLPEGVVWGNDRPQPLDATGRFLASTPDGLADLQLSLRSGALHAEVVRRVRVEGAVTAATLTPSGDLLLGLGHPARGARWWTSGGLIEPALPDVSVVQSDVTSLGIGDIDGDGQAELMAAVGPWRSYDVRILEGRGTGWATRARARLGFVEAVVPLGEGRLLALKGDQYPNAEVWGPDQPYGLPAGIYVLHDRGDRLVVEHHLPFPSEQSVVPFHPRAGDFDGDGTLDVVFGLRGSWEGMMVLRGRPDGAFDVGLVGGVFPVGAVEVDGDPAKELVVRLPDHGQQNWVLGAGARALPVAAHPPPVAEVAVATQAGQRASELARAGLPGEAARLARALAEVEGNSASRTRLLAWSAGILDGVAAPEEAAKAWEQAGQAGAAGATERALLAWERAHRPTEVVRVASALSGDRQDSHPLTRWRQRAEGPSWRAGDPVPMAWTLPHPAAVRLHPPGEVGLDLLGGHPAAIAIPVRWDGRYLEVEAEVDLIGLEMGAGVVIRLQGDDATLLSVSLELGGGGGLTELRADCAGRLVHARYGSAPESRRFQPLGSAVLRLTLDAEAQQGWCEVRRGDLAILHEPMVAKAVATPGAYRLEIRGRDLPDARGLIHLLRLDVRGAALDEIGEDPDRRRLAEGDAAGAWAGFQARGLHDLAAVSALRSGDLGRAVAALRAMDPTLPIPEPLRLEMRVRPLWTNYALNGAGRPLRPQERMAMLVTAVDAPYDGLMPLLTLPIADLPLDDPLHRQFELARAEALLELAAPDLAWAVANRLAAAPEADAEQRSRAHLVLAQVAHRRGRPAEVATQVQAARAAAPDPELVDLITERWGLTP